MTSPFRINASLQLLPLTPATEGYAWVDKAIEIVSATKLTYTVGPFSTSVEGTWDEIAALLATLNNNLVEKGCPEWVLQVQFHVKNGAHVKAADKVLPHAL